MSKELTRSRKWLRKLATVLLLLFFVLCFITAYFYHNIFISVPPGHVAGKWERFNGGINVDKTYKEGFHFNWPWDIMRIFDTRLVVESRQINVLSRDGLGIDLDVSVRYRLNGHKAALLYKHIRENYVDIILLPEVESHSRLEFARYSSEEIYSLNRNTIQQDILNAVVHGIKIRHTDNSDHSDNYNCKSDDDCKVSSEREPFIYVEDILIKSIVLPKTVRESIQRKISQKHLMLSYEYRLTREKLESQRKRIEALGIRNFQDMVGEGISDRYLRWKGIDATLALASSNNSKVVVIGAGDEGLPLILGNMGEEKNTKENVNPTPSAQLSTETLSQQMSHLKQQMDQVTDTEFNDSLFNKVQIDHIPEAKKAQ